MRFEHLTDGMRKILLSWARGYTAWVGIYAMPDKVPGILERWSEEFGTRLPAAHRYYRRKKGLPTAVAYDLPTPRSDKRTLVLLATADAPTFGRNHPGPWGREKWRTDPVQIADYVISRDQRPDRSFVWTWKMTPRAIGIEEKYLLALVKGGATPATIAAHAKHLVAYHPMFGGVRRQLRRMLKSAAKLYKATRKGAPWPGPDPDGLPYIGSFEKAGTTERVQAQEAE